MVDLKKKDTIFFGNVTILFDASVSHDKMRSSWFVPACFI